MKLINIYKQLLKENERNQRFDYVYRFNQFGLAKVRLNDKYNLINKEGKLLFKTWYDKIKTINNNKFILINNDKTYKVLKLNN